MDLIPREGTKIPHATQRGRINKKEKAFLCLAHVHSKLARLLIQQADLGADFCLWGISKAVFEQD